MKANDVLQRLVQNGAVIADAEASDLRLLLIHAELVTPAPFQTPPAKGWLYYVEAGAEDQHHAHFRPYANVEVVHDRDMSLTDAYGSPVAYVAPIEEWPMIDVQSTRDRLALARRAVSATAEDQAAWNDFVEGCRPRSEDAAA